MDNLEGLIIYKQYMELIYYTENITIKYPKNERESLVKTIKNSTYKGMELIIMAQNIIDKTKRLNCLFKLDVQLKMIKVLIRLSFKRKYINDKNYYAWSKKLTNISNLMGGWIRSCHIQSKTNLVKN